MNDLFAGLDDGCQQRLAEGAVILRGFARIHENEIRRRLATITTQAPFRHMTTPGGYRMSVAMTNCGAVGWVTDQHGYRYIDTDPQSGRCWPQMPVLFSMLARQAAEQAGFPGFKPDACLINRYVPGSKLSLHQDKDEADLRAPIVSVSLGLTAIFLWGGLTRHAPIQRIVLAHGDVMVWGGPSRLRYHGVHSIEQDRHPGADACRLVLTFRQAGTG